MKHVWPVVFIIVLPLWITMGTVLWWWLDPRVPDEVLTPPIAINSPVKRGDFLRVRWHYYKHRNCVSRFERAIFNDQVIKLPDVSPANLPANKEHSWVANVPLPKQLGAGEYTYRVRGIFKCNPLFFSYLDYPPVPFEVLDID